MRVLRSTLYKSPTDMTQAVVRESDVVSIEETMRHPVLDMLVLHDVFEMDGEPTLEAALVEAALRFRGRQQAERHMAFLYYFEVAKLRQMTPDGTLSMDQPTPLAMGDVKKVLAAIAVNPVYKQQTVIALDNEGKVVTLARGIVREDA